MEAYSRIMGLPWQQYLSRLLPIYLAVFCIGALTYLSAQFFPLHSLVRLVLLVAVISAVYLVLAYQLGLSAAEKEALQRVRKRFSGGGKS